MSGIPHQDTEEIKARAAFAKALLEDKAFQYAMIELRKRWFHDWLATGGHGEKSIQLCAQINALESVGKELAILINDYKAMVRRNN